MYCPYCVSHIVVDCEALEDNSGWIEVIARCARCGCEWSCFVNFDDMDERDDDL